MGKLPSTQAIKKSINRLRNKVGAVPANPLNLRDLVIPEQYKHTTLVAVATTMSVASPWFPKELWSVHARTVGNQDRTNNHAEAAHRKLQAMLQMDHPSLWKFIEALMHAQNDTDYRYEHYVRGDQNVPKRKKIPRG